MRVPIYEALLMVVSGIFGIIVFAYVWEKLVDLVFGLVEKWWYKE